MFVQKLFHVITAVTVIFYCHYQDSISNLQIKETGTLMNAQKIIRPRITSEFELLDINKYERLGVLEKNELQGDNNSIITYTSLHYTCSENGETYRLRGDKIGGYYSSQIADSSFIEIVKNYYPDGKIRNKALILNTESTNFLIGTEYRFDQEGNLIYAVNNDIGYDFSIENVLQYLMEVEKLPLKSGFLKNGDFMVDINKQPDNTNALWTMTWRVFGDEMDTQIKLILDGITGEVISRTEEKVPVLDE